LSLPDNDAISEAKVYDQVETLNCTKSNYHTSSVLHAFGKLIETTFSTYYIITCIQKQNVVLRKNCNEVVGAVKP
jgi:hypothetical protein